MAKPFLDVASPLEFPNVGGSGITVTIIEGADNRIYDLSLYGHDPNATGQALIDWPWPAGSNPAGTTILFDKPLQYFSLRAGDFGADDDTPVVITAYDASGNVLGMDSALWPAWQSPPFATLTIIQSGIRRIVYSSGGTYANSTFIDDLTLFPAADKGDLIGAFGSFPDHATASKSIDVPTTVTNQGQAKVEGTLSITYYISTDTSLDAGDVEVGSISGQSITLESGQSANFSATLNIPPASEAGSYHLIAKIDSANAIDESSEENNLVVQELKVLRLSGAEWESAFPGSDSISDLDPTFAAQVTQFISAVEVGGATVNVSATYRPPERAYLMHWAWLIAEQHYAADTVPEMEEVYIDWWHGDQGSSEAEAGAMVAAFAIDPNLKVAPALQSNHTLRLAIDMTITWQGKLTVVDGNGNTRTIKGGPRNTTNSTLIDIAATFGVVHFPDVHKDRNHWSLDGH